MSKITPFSNNDLSFLFPESTAFEVLEHKEREREDEIEDDELTGAFQNSGFGLSSFDSPEKLRSSSRTTSFYSPSSESNSFASPLRSKATYGSPFQTPSSGSDYSVPSPVKLRSKMTYTSPFSSPSSTSDSSFSSPRRNKVTSTSPFSSPSSVSDSFFASPLPGKVNRLVFSSPSAKSGSFESPEKVKNKKAKYDTPEKNKEARELLESMTDEDLMVSLTKQDKQTLQEGIKAVTLVQDSPMKKRRFAVADKTVRTMLRLASPETEGQSPERRFFKPRFHKDLVSPLSQSSWFSDSFGHIVQIQRECRHKETGSPEVPDKVFDLEHIIAPVASKGKKGDMGFHFCPKKNPLFSSLKQMIVNSETGVFCAKFSSGKQTSEGQKYSSFFPSWISDEETLLQVLMKGKEIAKCKNRALYFVKNKTSFYFEAYNRPKRGINVVNSSFPIFSFADLSKEYGGSLGGIFEVSQETLIIEAKNMLRKLIQSSIDLKLMPTKAEWQNEWLMRQPCKIDDNQSPLRFVIPSVEESSALLVFDFAPMFSSKTGVEKGMYVAIPKSSLEEVIGLDAILNVITKM